MKIAGAYEQYGVPVVIIGVTQQIPPTDRRVGVSSRAYRWMLYIFSGDACASYRILRELLLYGVPEKSWQRHR